jgi:CrcB protein
MTVVVVLLAGAAGALLRYAASLVSPRWSVLAVNVIGSFIGGVALATLTGDARLILLTGFCGGLTTFSTFSVETVQAVLDGHVRRAAASVAANLVLGVGAAALGYLVSR